MTAWGTLAAALAALLALVAAAFAAGGSDGIVLGVLGALIVLRMAAPTVPGVRGRRIRRGELVLTPQTLTLRSWNSDRTLAWDDVYRVVLLTSPRRTLTRVAPVGLAGITSWGQSVGVVPGERLPRGGRTVISNADELRAAFRERWSTGDSSLRVLPGPDEQRDPEGCVVVDGRREVWSVYRVDRGIQDRRDFATAAEAFDFAHRRWVLWDEDA